MGDASYQHRLIWSFRKPFVVRRVKKQTLVSLWTDPRNAGCATHPLTAATRGELSMSKGGGEKKEKL